MRRRFVHLSLYYNERIQLFFSRRVFTSVVIKNVLIFLCYDQSVSGDRLFTVGFAYKTVRKIPFFAF